MVSRQHGNEPWDVTKDDDFFFFFSERYQLVKRTLSYGDETRPFVLKHMRRLWTFVHGHIIFAG
jgi:hypothetical protein